MADDEPPIKRQRVEADQQGPGAAQAEIVASEPNQSPTLPEHQRTSQSQLVEDPAGPGPSSSAAERPNITPGAYSQREEALIKREQDGDIAFRYVHNNDDPQNLIYLVGLKNIFSKQLPNMPKEYIVRLVMDRRHRSVALLKRNGTVIGGITYRAFHAQGFGEIAFCAVTSHEQVKGYGTRLMNHTKEFARTIDRLTHFLTYADNNAVGYFDKQGFTREITLERERWQGYIKDYDGGTLMECVMHPHICFIALPDLVHMQRLALDDHIRQLSNSHVILPGLRHFVEEEARVAAALKLADQQQPEQADTEAQAVEQRAQRARLQRRTAVPIGDIPGVREAGWSPDMVAQGPRYRLVLEEREPSVALTPENLQAFLRGLLEHVKGLEDAWPFRERVAVQDAPDYYDIIKDPIALDVMEERLASQVFYATLDIFNADLRRVFENCRFYNSPDTIYYKLANKLESLVNQYLTMHMIAEEDGSAAPAR